MDDSMNICDEVIEKIIPTNFNEQKATTKTQNFYILLEFLLITTALLIAVSIYCYLIKYEAKHNELKQILLLPFHDTNNELKQILYK